jgi:hypothetical protein
MLFDKERCPHCSGDIEVEYMPPGSTHYAALYCIGDCSNNIYNSPKFLKWIPKPGTDKRKTNTKKLRKLIPEQTHCVVCDEAEIDARMPFHVHHRIPVEKGGTDDANNLLLLCEICHIDWHQTKRLRAKLRWYMEGVPS